MKRTGLPLAALCGIALLLTARAGTNKTDYKGFLSGVDDRVNIFLQYSF